MSAYPLVIPTPSGGNVAGPGNGPEAHLAGSPVDYLLSGKEAGATDATGGDHAEQPGAGGSAFGEPAGVDEPTATDAEADHPDRGTFPVRPC